MRSGAWRRGGAACAVALGFLTAGATAEARPLASVAGNTLTVSGDGAPADLFVRPVSGGVEVAGADAGAGCTGSADGASCPTTASTVLRATLSAAPETLRGTARFPSAIVDGGDGDDTLIWGAPTPATLRGGPGADRLTAQGTGAGAVTIEGGVGDDRLQMALRSGSPDTVSGGPDRDLVTYAGRLGAVSLTLDGVRNDGALSENDLLGTGIETLVGTADDDQLLGNGGANTLDGGQGSDRITGGGGRDTLSYALAGQRPEGVTVDLETGVFADGDVIVGIRDVTGSLGSDFILGTRRSETLDGAAGIDVIEGRFGDDTLIGGTGRDTVSAQTATGPVGLSLDGAGSGSLDSVGRPNEVYLGFEAARGSPFDDLISGSAAADALDGGGGDDRLAGAGGIDVYTGGEGIDTVSYIDRTEGVTIDAGDPARSVDTEVFPADVERLEGSEFADVIVGGPGIRFLSGRDGDDVFLSGEGTAFVDGNDGADELRFDDQAGGVDVTLNGLAPGGRGRDARSGDNWRSVERLAGSPAADVVDASGDRGTNVLRFGAGDKISYAGRDEALILGSGLPIDGGAGERDVITAEILEGGTAGDAFFDEAPDTPNRFIGGPGDDRFTGKGLLASGSSRPEDTPRDVFDGGDGRDILFFPSSLAVRLSLADRSGSFNDELLGLEDLVGGVGDDTLIGDDGPNNLDGAGGADTLAGLGGDDRFQSDPGADSYDGGSGRDSMSYPRSPNGVSVTPDDVRDDGAPGENDNVGANVEFITGSDHADRLVASNGTLSLSGRAGDDVIVPRAVGATELEGGQGTDTLDAGRRVAPEGLTLSADQAAEAGGMGYKEFENLTGTAGPDVLRGSPGVNELRGSGGDDKLDGGPGADLVLGGTGADAITDADADADQLGGSILMRGGGVIPEERTQADSVAAGSMLPAARIIRDDRLIVQPLDPARRVVVDLAARRTDLGDVLADIEAVSGTPGPDTLIGDAGENILSGAGGDDDIRGGGQNDRLRGGDGDDLVSDFSVERDALQGDAGNDLLSSLDFAAPEFGDELRCGAGTADSVLVDLADTVPDDCEGLTSAPVGQHPLTRVRAISRRVDARGRVLVRISCPRGVRQVCRGALTVERGTRRSARPKVLGSRTFRVRAGRSQAVRVRLSHRAQRRIVRRGRLGVRLAARDVDARDRPRETSVPAVLRSAA